MLGSFLTLMFLAGSLSRQPYQACPQDHPSSSALVNRFLTRDTYFEDRVALGFQDVAMVRPLTDARDASACQWFVGKFGVSGTNPRWHWSAYEIGNYYVVAFRYINEPGQRRMGFTPLLVFDRSYQQVRGLAM